ncbi:MAG: hypothetical protein HQM12_09800 [SAR324 cluster bacterium]|nr:hypothetical protein [SAR324 cluster bacterium]
MRFHHTSVLFIKINLSLFVFWLAGCSYHYDQGQLLEAEKRWEESAIEYRLAFVEDPEDSDIIEALDRVNPKVAEENMTRYREYLAKQQYHKAFRRLEAAAALAPKLQEAQDELKQWTRVLIAGKVLFTFERGNSEIGLAEQMQFQIWITNPVGETLKADIAYENGLFFTEDLLYRHTSMDFGRYSLDAIGLSVTRKAANNFDRQTFRKFINFRVIPSAQVSGSAEILSGAVQSVANHRSQFIKNTPENAPWNPLGILRYQMTFENQRILVDTSAERLEFVPEALYINREQRRAFVDFGVYQVVLDSQTKWWHIQRKHYASRNDDYFYTLNNNLALNPYFFYKEGAFQYVLAPRSQE